MGYKSFTRVLALDLHPRRFGYVVLEGPDRLLDWGVCTARQKRNSEDVLIRRRLGRLLTLWSPSVIVLHDHVGRSRSSIPRRDRSLNLIRIEAKHRRILVRSLKTEDLEIQGMRITHFEN